ncbi:MAG: AMP phosphorylase [Candidatus Pacebacteria bacterium]|nr:AMP phosphorylase [Candidatus Paceibacterota bacterium]
MEKNRNKKFFLKVKYLDITTGYPWIVIINEEDGKKFGVRPGDELSINWQGKQTEIKVDITNSFVEKGEIGVFKDIIEKYQIKEGESLELALAREPESLKIIHKKLQGKKLSYAEILELISDTVSYKLDDLQLAFFVASAFFDNNFSKKEIYYLTKAMAETGEQLKFGNTVADKHSIGGIPGNRVTPIVVPIVASCGIIIPKTSSRAITSAAGTADTMEVLAPVNLTPEQIKKTVKETNACLSWGGAFKLAPADDRFVKITHQLRTEPYSKMVVSIMAKKVACGITHLIIDIPIGPTAKIINDKDEKLVKDLFISIAKKFGIKIKIIISKTKGPIGRGIGPVLEARDVMRVLEQKENRPLDLEKKSIQLAGMLLELVGKAKKGKGKELAYENLKNGQALAKMKEIIKVQGGNPEINSEALALGKAVYELKSKKGGFINSIHNKNLTEICYLLGAPQTKEAGIYLNKTVGEKVKKGETLCSFYTAGKQRLDLARHTAEKIEIFNIS